MPSKQLMLNVALQENANMAEHDRYFSGAMKQEIPQILYES